MYAPFQMIPNVLDPIPSLAISEYEDQLKTYDGEDPLELWLEYISWIEQAFPSSGKSSELQAVLERCLQLFEHDARYKQDRRMIRTYIKFVSCHSTAILLSFAN